MRFFVFRPPAGEARSAYIHDRLFVEGDLAFGDGAFLAKAAPHCGEGAFDYLTERQVEQLVTAAGVKSSADLPGLDQATLNRARDKIRSLGDSGEPPPTEGDAEDPLAARVRRLVAPGGSERLKKLARAVGLPVGSMEANAAGIVEAITGSADKRAIIKEALEGS